MHPLTRIEEGRMTACAAVVVTYHPSAANLTNLTETARQFARVFVVDNGSSPVTRQALEDIARQTPQLSLQLLPQNLGLATGLNLGTRAAQAAGFSWVALFDQDTVIPPGYCAEIATAVTCGNFDEQVALFAPRHTHPQSSESSAYAPGLQRRGDHSEVAATITSGSFISLAAYQKLGGFDDGLFVDFIDYDYGFRLAAAGYRQIQLDQVRLPHEVGERARRSILGIPVTVNLHSPVRQYYIMRNRLRLVARHGFRYPNWAARELAYGTVGWLLLALAGPERWKVFTHGLRGAFDAARGRMGAYRKWGARS